MGQRLVVKCHGLVVDGNAERVCDVESIGALRQLPQPAEQALGRAAGEHHAIAVRHPQRGAREHRQLALLLARGDDRQLVMAAGARGGALRGERADEAARRGRRAQRRAELHQSLVEIAGRVLGGQRGHQLAGALPQCTLAGARLDVVLDREDAGEHARDVTVDERCALAIRDRRDRARGVRSDARHLAQLARAPRQRAAMRGRDRACAGVQVTGTRVVAEPGPRGEHVVEGRRGERPHRRKPRHPALPVRDHRLHARLLQHDLADPDRVRIARAPPGQVAAVAPVVRDDS